MCHCLLIASTSSQVGLFSRKTLGEAGPEVWVWEENPARKNKNKQQEIYLGFSF